MHVCDRHTREHHTVRSLVQYRLGQGLKHGHEREKKTWKEKNEKKKIGISRQKSTHTHVCATQHESEHVYTQIHSRKVSNNNIAIMEPRYCLSLSSYFAFW